MLNKYLEYLRSVRRYSERTCTLYSSVLSSYLEFQGGDGSDWPSLMTPSRVRNYEIHLIDSRGLGAKTVNMHLSVLSGFSRFLMKNAGLSSNPVRMVSRPKIEKRLPLFYRKDAMDSYFQSTCGVMEFGSYEAKLNRLIINMLYCTGLRRSELISLNRSSFDPARSVLRVKGKGGKMREIPLVSSLSKDILLYLQSVDSLKCADTGQQAPLLQTPRGGRLYPVFVDRVVKKELGGVPQISCRKSPHVLRHTLATELLEEGSDLYSIKELLGHSSLASTQVYTHTSMERLKSVYNNAHPRAKNGGKNGD
ncbi:MAG: tyrosine-type recombinase/integrase [Bacteroidales bacterium]|nr:tyrosine-type recombinase/integrase [Bacteroidales bacterium]